MTTTAENLADPELLQTEWDLSPLVDDDPEGGVDRQLEQARDRATAFAERHAGHVAELDIEGLRDAMQEHEAINELIGKAASYASLRFATDTADPARGALLQRMQELATEIETKLLFFELEWAALDDQRADELLAGEGLDFCRHYLRSVR
ncbi:MAG: oligoendopeptidase, partial [Solirubrobacteraceae bacterium]